MKVSPSLPFRLVYTIFKHTYLGYQFEACVVRLNDNGSLTFQHQNISSQNAHEFAKGLDDIDYELISLIDSMNQNAILKTFSKTKMKPQDFFSKVYDNASKTEDQFIQIQIKNYMEKRKSSVLEKLKGKQLYEMRLEGKTIGSQIEILTSPAKIQFHIFRNSESTIYYPKIFFEGRLIELPNESAYLVCHNPAWLAVNKTLYHFESKFDGQKLLPFLSKRNIIVPKNIEDNYYRKFISPIVASFEDIKMKGFEVIRRRYDLKPKLSISELPSISVTTPKSLFGDNENSESKNDEKGKIVFDLSFLYGNHIFHGGLKEEVCVVMDRKDGNIVLHRVERDLELENTFLLTFLKWGLPLGSNFRTSVEKGKAFEWINENRVTLLDLGFEINQPKNVKKSYFVGKASFEVEINEGSDWFNLSSKISFGEFKISFNNLRKLILKNEVEFELPDGRLAIIPKNWITKYRDLFIFSEISTNRNKPILKKHHVHLVKELQNRKLARVHTTNNLDMLANFNGIKEYSEPTGFVGSLRPYQKAGYNWLRFLNEYNIGGCLADDMGLGKTIQTLALLQSEKENGSIQPSLLIMPTSLIYNWEKETMKFTPHLKVLSYTGINRKLNSDSLDKWDLILTSYNITRFDVDVLLKYNFNYIILDESQIIKSPTSIISNVVLKLKSKHKLTLTGTPIENTTLDLWSQMTFINPGILGKNRFFKNEFQIPIEKQNDESKIHKLNAIVKPFILRRLKSQVASELPEKVETTYYTNMSDKQEERYEEIKAHYKQRIFSKIESQGLNYSKMTILEGLSKLRQIANHPRMIDVNYTGDSGKLKSLDFMIEDTLNEGHKILIFSQFVKHLSIVSELLDSKKMPYAYLDGSSKDRKEEVERFNCDAKLKIFLISIKAGGLGLNLTEADYVFILDPWWNPAVEQQAIDRAHRIGQKKKVFAYKFITRNTVEEKILLIQERKKKLSKDLIKVEEAFVKSLTLEDLKMILS